MSQRLPPPGIQAGYTHGEAFCLMKYATDDGEDVEWLWNSRDGVTPFCLNNRAGDKQMTHVDWGLDRVMTKYWMVLKPGERVFVNIADYPEIVRQRATEFVEHHWNREGLPMSAAYESRAVAMEAMIKSWTEDPTQPMVITGAQFLSQSRATRSAEAE